MNFPDDALDDLVRVGTRLIELVNAVEELGPDLDTDDQGVPIEPESEEIWEVQSLEAIAALLLSLSAVHSGIADEAGARADWASEQARAREYRSEAWDDHEQEVRQHKYDDEASARLGRLCG